MFSKLWLKQSEINFCLISGLKSSDYLDAIGPLVRHAEDLAVLDKVVTDEEPLQPPKPHEVRIGVPRRHFWENVDPEIKQAAEKFLRKLEYAGFFFKWWMTERI